MTYIFQSGLFAGKSVAQVAVSDFTSRKHSDFDNRNEYGEKLGNFTDIGYLHLKRVLENRQKERKDSIMDQDIKDVIEKLNNFVPAVKCKYENCDKIADYLSIAMDFGEIPRGGDNYRNGVTGISVSTGYSWCEEHKNDYEYKKAQRYDIKFDTLEDIPSWPKWVRKDVLKVLLESAGFKGKRNYDNCENFIKNLAQKPKIIVPKQTTSQNPQTLENKIKKMEQGELF